jgi:hypothetical protein
LLPFSEIFCTADHRRTAIFFIGGFWEKQRTTGNGQLHSFELTETLAFEEPVQYSFRTFAESGQTGAELSII